MIPIKTSLKEEFKLKVELLLPIMWLNIKIAKIFFVIFITLSAMKYNLGF